MNATLTATPNTGSRNQARKLLTELPDNLTGTRVSIECASMSGTPSFIDEIVKIVLKDRGADCLRLIDPPVRTEEFARESAKILGIADRLIVDRTH